MTEDQETIVRELTPRLGYLTGPLPVKPRWWQFSLRRYDKRVRLALEEAGLPCLTEDGRWRYYLSGPQGFEDAGGYWSRKWCAALGLSYLDGWTDEIHPRALDHPKHEIGG